MTDKLTGLGPELTVTLDPRIDIYKLFVETAERNVERRLRSNQFYFSIVAALFVAYSWLAQGRFPFATPAAGAADTETGTQSLIEMAALSVPLWVLPLFLLVVSLSWLLVLLSFRALSAAKYKVVHEMEKELPFQPFDREWAHYKQIRKVETTQLELLVPLLFCVAAIAGLAVPFL